MFLTTLAFAAIAKQSPALVPGMKAPKLTVGGWLKQGPPKVQKGRWRVVEFWATWCAPCRAAMPHLSELARKYSDRLDIVGVSVSESPQTTPTHLRRFAQEMGDKMDYRVAYDTPTSTMGRSWLAAAGLNSIPATFLMDDTDTILWIGHPNGLEAQLANAFAGKTDLHANRSEFVSAINWSGGSKAVLARADEAYRAGRTDEAARIWKEALAQWPRSEFMVRRAQLFALPFGSPEHTVVVDRLLGMNAVAREAVIEYALTLPSAQREEAEALIDRTIEGTPQDRLLHVAASAYLRLKAYAKAIRAADAAIAVLDAQLRDPRNASRRAVIGAKRAKSLKVRDEAAGKGSRGGTSLP